MLLVENIVKALTYSVHYIRRKPIITLYNLFLIMWLANHLLMALNIEMLTHWAAFSVMGQGKVTSIYTDHERVDANVYSFASD